MMDIHAERDQIQEELFQLIENHANIHGNGIPTASFPYPDDAALPPKVRAYIDRLLAQAGQTIRFCSCVTQISECFLQLAQGPEMAEELAEEGIERIHTFLNGMNELLTLEYRWCGRADDRALSEAYWAYRRSRRAHLCRTKQKRSFTARPKRT